MQDLKRTGLNKIKLMFTNEPEIVIQERGKDACMLVDLEYYTYLRNCELEIALIKAKVEITNGKFTTGAEQHIRQLETAVDDVNDGILSV